MAATDFSSLFAGEKIKKADLIQLKQEIREMILKRIYNVNISQYGSSLYDYTDSQKDLTLQDEEIINDYFNKILEPMQAINPTKLGFNEKYDATSKKTTLFKQDEAIPNLKELISFFQICQAEENQNKLDISKSNCLNQCTGMCVDLCAVGCTARCASTCSGSCTGRTCRSGCDAGSGGSTPDPDPTPPPAGGGGGCPCQGNCSGSCNTGCDTSCKGGCHRGCYGYACKNNCNNTCSGSCGHGSCSAICNGGTQGSQH